MTPTFLADRRIGRVTRPLDVRPVVRPAVPSFSVVDEDGHLHPGIVRGTTAKIPSMVCSTSQSPAVVPLPAVVSPGRWKLQLGYLTNRQTTARVAIGDNPRSRCAWNAACTRSTSA